MWAQLGRPRRSHAATQHAATQHVEPFSLLKNSSRVPPSTPAPTPPTTPTTVVGSGTLTALPVPPPLPSWAKPQKDTKQKNIDAVAANRKVVTDANAKGTMFDFVLYGDSITRNIRDKYFDIWTKFFGGLNAVPLGVGGHTVEELSYRIAKGGELLKVSPKVVGLLIGINNLKFTDDRGDPASKLDQFLLPYLKAVYPSSRILLLSILPNKERNVAPTNAKYKALAVKHGVDFVECGRGIDPNNTRHLADGTHPAADGYVKLFTCLRPVVDAAVKTVFIPSIV